jgi:hypothetical protein
LRQPLIPQALTLAPLDLMLLATLQLLFLRQSSFLTIQLPPLHAGGLYMTKQEESQHLVAALYAPLHF